MALPPLVTLSDTLGYIVLAAEDRTMQAGATPRTLPSGIVARPLYSAADLALSDAADAGWAPSYSIPVGCAEVQLVTRVMDTYPMTLAQFNITELPHFSYGSPARKVTR